MIYNKFMKNLFFLLSWLLFSIQSYAGYCPDGSDPVKSISADGTYFVFKCGSSSNNSSESAAITKFNNSSKNTNSIKIPFNKGSD